MRSDNALAGLTVRYGDEIGNWRWGIAHTALHHNRTLSEVSTSLFGMGIGLASFVNIEQETSGGDHTLNRGAMAHGGPTPFRNIHGSGYRGIYDFSDLDRSVYVISTGVSGHPIEELVEEQLAQLRAVYDGDVLLISGVTGTGVRRALGGIARHLELQDAADALEAEDADGWTPA